VNNASEALRRCCRSRLCGCDRGPDAHNLPRPGDTSKRPPRTAARAERTA